MMKYTHWQNMSWNEKRKKLLFKNKQYNNPNAFGSLRYELLEERNFICKKCKKKFESYKLIMHHNDNDKNNNTKKNLIVLCISCHMKLHNPRSYRKYRKGKVGG